MISLRFEFKSWMWDLNNLSSDSYLPGKNLYQFNWVIDLINLIHGLHLQIVLSSTHMLFQNGILLYYPTLARGSRVLGCVRKICISNAGTHGHTNQFSQSGQSRSHSWPVMQCPIAWTWKSTPKQCAVMAIVEERSLTFMTILRELIYLICFLSVG